MHDFVISCLDYLENIGSLTYVALTTFGTFHHTVSKHNINVTTRLIKKVFKS